MIKLLFVDDDAGVAESIKMVFKTKPNYELSLASTGQEALQITKETNPQLVILDMVLDDMPGEEVFKQLKTINPQIKIIFMTGLKKEKVAEKAKQLGAQGYLIKPFDIFKLEDYFKQVVPELYQ